MNPEKNTPPISPSPSDFMSSFQHMLKCSAARARALSLRIPTRGRAPREVSGLLSSTPRRNGEPGNASEPRKACCSSEMAIQPNCIPVLCQLYARFISFHWSNGQQLNLISKTTLTQSHTVLNVMKSFSSLSPSAPPFFSPQIKNVLNCIPPLEY